MKIYRNRDIRLCKYQRFYLITPALTVYEVSELESEIWKLCNGVSTDEIYGELTKRHGKDYERLRKNELEDIIRQFKECNLVTSGTKQASCGAPIPEPKSINNIFVGIKACNLKCSYCPIDDSSPKISYHDLMSTIDNLLPQLAYHSTMTFGYGEPLLVYEHIFNLIDYITKKDAEGLGLSKFLIVTNGTLINSKITNRLKQINEVDSFMFLATPVVRIAIKLDGPEYIHNRYCVDSFCKVLEAIKALRKSSIPYSLILTLTPLVLRNIEQVVGYLLSFEPENLLARFPLLQNEPIRTTELETFVDYLRKKEILMMDDVYFCAQKGIIGACGTNKIALDLQGSTMQCERELIADINMASDSFNAQGEKQTTYRCKTCCFKYMCGKCPFLPLPYSKHCRFMENLFMSRVE